MSAGYPDPLAALVEHLRGNTRAVWPGAAAVRAELLSIAPAAWIGTYIRDPAQMPRAAVVVGDAGGRGRADNLPRVINRAHVRCYAASGWQTQRMSTLARWLLLPPDAAWSGWTAANVCVPSVLSVTMPVALADPDTGWLYREWFVEYETVEAVAA